MTKELIPEVAWQATAAPTQQSPSLYANNPLIEACGPILTRRQIASRLLFLPDRPVRPLTLPPHLLVHEVANLRRIHVPSEAGIRIAETLAFLVRQGYVHRNPADITTRRMMYGLPVNTGSHAAIQLASAVVGLSGVGKSEAIERALALMPQVVVHEKLPGLEGPVRQLVWLKLDVPDTGRLKDLVASLFRAADQALGSGYFDLTKSGRQRLGADAAEEWIAKMRCHFLGVLVLDEIQNLFRMLSREMRQVAKRRGQDRLELRVVEDQAAKFILNLTNCTKFPVMVSGTPDGIAALETRMSTASRISTGGLIAFPRADSPDDLYFSKVLLPRLVEYQWLPRSIEISAELRGRLHRLSGGILRNAIGLWQHGQQRAIMAGSEALCIDDFEHVAGDVLAMNRGAIDALLSQDPRRMAQYEDLVPYHRS